MSSITNGWLAFIAIIALMTFALLLAVFVMMVVNLAKVNGITRRTGGPVAQTDSTTSSAISAFIQGLKAENTSLQSQVQFEQSARASAESRAEAAELAAKSAASVTREQVRQGVEKARTKEMSELQEKLRGAELHSLALHQECADLRAKLAKTDKRAAANNVDLSETEELLDKASRRLIAVDAEREAAQREVEALRLEIDTLRAEIASLLTRLGEAPPKTASETSTAPLPTVAPVPAPKAKPKIVTRTTSAPTSGISEFDEADKQWDATEDTDLLTAYVSTRSLVATAETVGVDQRQVALRLISLLLAPQGLVDDPSAPKHGKTYTAADSKAIVQAWRDGRKLPAIARDFQRDQLGIGWKLLDHKSRPVDLTARMIPDIVEEAHR